MSFLLTAVFDAEITPHGWDVRVWPIGRFYYEREGARRRLGVYRIGRWEWAGEWRRGC